MTGVRARRALVLPFRHLGECAQAGDSPVPAQLAGPERRRGEPAVAADEPPGQHPAEPPDERPLPARLQRRGYSLAGIRDLLGAWESGTDLTTLLGVGQGQAVLDEAPLRLTRAELLQRLPALADAAALDRARRAGLVRQHGQDHVIVRSPALLALAADWVHAGVPAAEVLGLIEVLTGDLSALARTLAGLIAGPAWTPAADAGDLPGLLRRGRPLLLQGAASMLVDRLGTELAERAEASGDSRLLAALDSARVGAVTDSAGTIHRSGSERGGTG